MNNIVFAGAPCGEGLHMHKGFEIVCAHSRGEAEADGEKLSYSRGDVVIIPRRIMHADVAGRGVIIENALISLRRPCVINGRGAEELGWACACAGEYFVADEKKKRIMMDGLGSLICALIAAYCGANPFSPAVEGLIAEIDKGVSDPMFSLENALRALPLNYDYVRKLFKSETGQTPLEYLTAARMSLARRIILSGLSNRYTNYTVAQIAEMCGYSEPLYFSRVFKKYYGVSPSEYAEKNI